MTCAHVWRRLALLAIAMILISVPVGAQTPLTLTFMHFNDDYQLGPVDGGKAGGLDRLAYVAKQVRAQDPQAQMLFAGDLVSPSLESSVFRGAQMIDGMNALGVDASTLGNHEFDRGLDELQQRLAQSKFPWVATNVYGRTGRLPRIEFLLMRTVQGVSVGYFGLLTSTTPLASRPGPDVRFADELGTARAIVPILRQRGAQIVVGLTHLDMWQDVQILREVPGINLIIGGHDHDPMRQTVGASVVAKAGSDARWLGVVRIQVTADGRVIGIKDELTAITEKTPSDPDLGALVKRYADRMSRELDVVIGRTSVPLDARNAAVRTAESALGNLIADVMRQAVDADIAITNGGGIRSNSLFPVGEIKLRDVLGWLPFNNVVVKVRLSGTAVRAALENGVSQVENQGGRFPQVSGLAFVFSPGRPAGSRVTSVAVGGRPLDPTATYTLATNDFIRDGGDGFTMVRDAEVIVSAAGGPVMATAVAEAIRKAQTVNPRVEGRITIAP
jgi:2',3'-cyclic-nucleotide 2'-phosphodiesterase (5'-nucleotidase family)